MNKDKLAKKSTNKAESLPQPPGDSCGSPVSTSTKANGEKNAVAASNAPTVEASFAAGTVARFSRKIAGQMNPSADDLGHLRKMIVATPESWNLVNGHTDFIRETIIKKFYLTPEMRAVLLAEMDIFKKKMDYDNSSALEQMHIDHILTAHLQLRHAEQDYNNKFMLGDSYDLEAGRFWQHFLESAQLRFQRASESLARIQRLARTTPALQINIAQAGSKQVNVQGDAVAGGENSKMESDSQNR
jgi:hypothetical protein